MWGGDMARSTFAACSGNLYVKRAARFAGKTVAPARPGSTSRNPTIGIVLDPAIGALAMSASTIIVSINAMGLRRIKLA